MTETEFRRGPSADAPAKAAPNEQADDARLVAEELGEGMDHDGAAGVAIWLDRVLLPAYRERVIALARRCREQREELRRAKKGESFYRSVAESAIKVLTEALPDGDEYLPAELAKQAVAELERLRARVAALEPKCASCGGRVPDDACGVAPVLLCEPCMERLSHV